MAKSKPSANQRFNAYANAWSSEQDAVLRRLWPDRKAMEAALPERSPKAIKNRLLHLELRTDRPKWKAADLKRLRTLYPDHNRLNRHNFRQHFPGLTSWHQVTDHANRSKIKRPSKKPQITPHALKMMEAIRKRAWEIDLSLAALCRLLGVTERTFRPGAAGRTVDDWNLYARAIDELGGRLVPLWVEDEPEKPGA